MADRTPSPLDDPAPRGRHRFSLPNPLRGDAFGRGAEAFARLMGTPGFLVGMTIFCAVSVAFWMSFAAPVDGSLNTISSATRPPIAYASWSRSSLRVTEYLSSSGTTIV